MTAIEWLAEDAARCAAIAAEIPGYSGDVHYAYFRMLLAKHELKSMLIVGVYHGRDICFILDILARYHPERKMRIVGVDKFSDDYCDDWPISKMTLKWAEAGYGPAPSFEAAIRNTSKRPNGGMVELHQAKDADYLATCTEKFQCVYWDTAHDYETIARQIQASRAIADGNMIICGDDFADMHEWGVVRAVKEAFIGYNVFGGYIFTSNLMNLRPVVRVGDDLLSKNEKVTT